MVARGLHRSMMPGWDIPPADPGRRIRQPMFQRFDSVRIIDFACDIVNFRQCAIFDIRSGCMRIVLERKQFLDLVQGETKRVFGTPG